MTRTDATKTNGGRLKLDWRGRRAILDGREVAFSPREYALLSVFAEHPGATLTREELYELAWGRPPDSGSIKALSVTIARLRRKLGDSFPIASLYGFGYRYDPIG